jgi:hypothetical protein
MKTYQTFKTIVVAVSVIILSACGSKPTPPPINAADIPAPPGMDRCSPAIAALRGGLFAPWSQQDNNFTEGPYKRYKIETSDKGALTGWNVYRSSNVDPNTIETFYKMSLGTSSWERGKDFGKNDYKGFAWIRGKQAILVVVRGEFVQVLLLNK